MNKLSFLILLHIVITPNNEALIANVKINLIKDYSNYNLFLPLTGIIRNIVNLIEIQVNI